MKAKNALIYGIVFAVIFMLAAYYIYNKFNGNSNIGQSKGQVYEAVDSYAPGSSSNAEPRMLYDQTESMDTESRQEANVSDDSYQEPPEPVNPIGPQEINREELSRHSSKDDCWVVYLGVVYDVTKWLPEHKGGADKIAQFCGSINFEEAFVKKHKSSTDDKLMTAIEKGFIKEVGFFIE